MVSKLTLKQPKVGAAGSLLSSSKKKRKSQSTNIRETNGHDGFTGETQSVSKGVFVFKGSRSKKAHLSSEATSTYTEKTWLHSLDIFNSLRQEMFSEVFSAISDYTSSVASCSTIPTAVLLSGVNLPDHGDLFKSLVLKFQSTVTPHVASVNSSGVVGNTLRSMVQKIVTQLRNCRVEENENGEHEEKRENQTLPSLLQWYNNQYPSCPQERLARAKKPARPPLVVILEDFEGFNSQLLHDLVLNLSEYLTRLPFVLVFGVATTVTVIHRTLPHRVSKFIDIKLFSGQKSTDMLTKLIEKVVMGDHFKLGGNALDALMEIFTYNDFSVKRFLSGYKFCLLEHYRTSPLPSILGLNHKKRNKMIKNTLNRLDLDRCRSLSSFRFYVEGNIAERAHLLTDEHHFRDYLCESLDNLTKASSRFNVFVSCLHVLTKDLMGTPLGKHIHSVYRTAMIKNVVVSHEYREAFQLLNTSTSLELRNKLEAFRKCLAFDSSDELVVSKLEAATDHLKELDDFLENGVRSNEASPALGRKAGNSVAADSPKSDKKVNRFQLQERLLEQLKEKKRSSPFEDLRKKIVHFFHITFSETLMPPTRHPFHEIYFFDDSSSIRRHLMASPRAVIQTALEQPGVYLEDGELEIGSGMEVSPSLPDLSIAYKLHSECGKLINLFDWMQSWISIVHDSADSDDDCELDPTSQARFTQCVSTLQFLGFVKPSKRKTDHVSRLTWGGC